MMAELSPSRAYFETREICHRDVYRHLSILRKSLAELKMASQNALVENNLFWQQEIEKAKQDKDQEWLNRVNQAESENKQLKKLVQKLTSSNGYNVNNDLQLYEVEKKIDKLNRQLDQKIIHINQLQIAYAEQSKAMFELERSYVLLHCRYRKAFQLQSFKPRKATSEL